MRRAACALAALGLALAGCGESKTNETPGDTLSVYALLPLTGPRAATAADARDGVKLALAEARGLVGPFTVNFRAVDTADDGRVTPDSAAKGARRAAQDAGAIAAVGGLDAEEAAIAVPLLNEASVALVSPAVTYPGFLRPTGIEAGEPHRYYPSGARTYATVAGDDGAQARALVAGARAQGCGRLGVPAGAGRGERSLARAVVAAAGAAPARGGNRRCLVLTLSQPARAAELARAAAARGERVLAAGPLADPAFTRALGAATPRTSVLVPRPAGLPAGFAAVFRRTFGRAPGPWAGQGYVAGRAVLNAVRAAGERGKDRRATATSVRKAPATGPMWALVGVSTGGRLRTDS